MQSKRKKNRKKRKTLIQITQRSRRNQKIKMLKWRRNNHKLNKKKPIKRSMLFLKMITTIRHSLMLFGLTRKCQPRDR